jgi:lysophospholipase
MLTNNFHLNTEKQLYENYDSAIIPFWKNNAQSVSFIGVDNKKVHTVNIRTGNNKAIVICQGRNESALKYKELAFDLNQQGYDLFFIDHRGQGFSQRLGGDRHRSHINHFQDYIEDLNTYITSLKLAKHYQHRFLLSHSLGGTVSTLYLEQFKHSFNACILFCPMFSINFGMPNTIAKVITQSYSTINNWFFNKPCYVFNGHSYQTKPFDKNELTSSKLRFTLSNNIFTKYPETQLGSPTMHWVSESISAANQAIKYASLIDIPVLLIQAGADTIVSHAGQTKFFNNLTEFNNNELMIIPTAKHEILIEQDQYRIPALNKVLEFMNRIQNNE